MKLSQIAVWMVASLVVVTAFAQERPDLAGRVVSDDGAPIEDASVFIYTAGPRVGPGYI